uniref:Ig-like domain-containing protein n=1 Tax=Salmo trutta TaxID=8032 RepID=A0A673YU19_SALTR
TDKQADRQTRPGNTLKMTCSHHDKKYDKIYWYRQIHGQKLQLIGFLSFKEAFDVEENFNISGDAEDEGFLGSLAPVHCANYEAHFGSGTKLTVLDPNIKVTEPTVKVLAPSAKECKDRNNKKKKTLVCVATRFYPDHVTVFWQVNNVNRTEGAGTDNKALWDKDSLYSITSRLRVPAKDWQNPDNRFTCIVSFYNGNGYINVKHTISGDLQDNDR